MKTTNIISPPGNSTSRAWLSHPTRFAQVFTALTGYEFMPEESRTDLDVSPSKLSLLRSSFTNIIVGQLPSPHRE